MDHLSMLSPSSTIPSLFDRFQYYLASILVIDCFASFLGFIVGSQWLVYLWPITVTLLLPTLPLLSYPHTSSKTLQIYTLNESFLPVRNTYTRSSIALALTPFALILLALVSSYTLGLNAVITICLTGIAVLARVSEYYMKAWTDVVALLFANPGVKEGVVGGKRGIQVGGISGQHGDEEEGVELVSKGYDSDSEGDYEEDEYDRVWVLHDEDAIVPV
ncbi:hypothetical protein HDU79_003180 [Rhizoclosmatium sp. JEL0117]|nr:hypothetical protein HDU79_003180 [Rhizoclosmatium sp. JEL0117]